MASMETFFGEHNTTILPLLDKDRNEEDSYCDVMLQVEGESFNVHRCLLGSLSSYFNKLFKCKMKEKYDRTVYLKKFSPDTIKTVLDFIYTTKVIITEENATLLLEAADHFLLYELKRFCSKFLISTLTVINCLHLRSIGEVFHCKPLQSSSEEIVVKHFRKVVEQPNFKALSNNDMDAIIQALDQKVIGSAPVYEGILTWVHHDYDGRKRFFADLFMCVKLHLLPTKYLQEKVAQQELVKSSHVCKGHFMSETLYAMELQNCEELVFESSSSSENEDNGESESCFSGSLDQEPETSKHVMAPHMYPGTPPITTNYSQSPMHKPTGTYPNYQQSTSTMMPGSTPPFIRMSQPMQPRHAPPSTPSYVTPVQPQLQGTTSFYPTTEPDSLQSKNNPSSVTAQATYYPHQPNQMPKVPSYPTSYDSMAPPIQTEGRMENKSKPTTYPLQHPVQAGFPGSMIPSGVDTSVPPPSIQGMPPHLSMQVPPPFAAGNIPQGMQVSSMVPPLMRPDIKASRMSNMRPDAPVVVIQPVRNQNTSRGGRGGSQQRQGGGFVPKIIKKVSIQRKPDLNKAENAWKPSKLDAKSSAGSATEEEQTEQLLRKVRSILNKLTPTKFSVLMQKFQLLPINTEIRLREVSNLIFEGAIDQTMYCEMYAKLCQTVWQFHVTTSADGTQIASRSGVIVKFRSIILTNCQREFKKDRTKEEVLLQHRKNVEEAETMNEKQLAKQQLEVAEAKEHRRMLGNIRFIGELFKLNMLTESTMHNCIMTLFKSHEEESICRLLSTIGKDLDNSKGKKRMDQYFTQIDKRIQERKTSERVRFMLMDVVELRQNKWVQRAMKAQGPKTIDQIHADAKEEKEQLALQVAAAASALPMKPQGMPPHLSMQVPPPFAAGNIPKGMQVSSMVPPLMRPDTKASRMSNTRPDDPVVVIQPVRNQAHTKQHVTSLGSDSEIKSVEIAIKHDTPTDRKIEEILTTTKAITKLEDSKHEVIISDIVTTKHTSESTENFNKATDDLPSSNNEDASEDFSKTLDTEELDKDNLSAKDKPSIITSTQMNQSFEEKVIETVKTSAPETEKADMLPLESEPVSDDAVPSTVATSSQGDAIASVTSSEDKIIPSEKSDTEAVPDDESTQKDGVGCVVEPLSVDSSVADDNRKPALDIQVEPSIIPTDDLKPAFTQSVPNTSRGGRGGSQQRQGEGFVPKIIKKVSIQREPDLNKAENAWKPSKLDAKSSAGSATEEEQIEEILRNVRAILNKLTPSKFSSLMQKFQLLPINTEIRLREVINLIFEKAIDEPNFCEAYANMCRTMSQIRVTTSADGAQIASQSGVTVEFRKILLTRCQREFEKDRTNEEILLQHRKKVEEAKTPEEKQQAKDELETAEAKERRRRLGNIRFIGELFKLNMLTESIMHNCIMTLFKSREEESLVSLCRLLTTIGKDLDHPKGKQRMDQYFTQIDKIIRARKTSERVRFMLMDVVELRQNKWVQRAIKAQGLKTIDQIHADAKEEKEQLAFQVAAAASALPMKPQQRSGRMGSRGNGGLNVDEGWTKVGLQQKREQGVRNFGRNERQSALVRVRSLTLVEKRRASPVSFSPLKKTSAPPPAPAVDEGTLMKKIKSIIQEYLHLVDVKEAIETSEQEATECFDDLKITSLRGHLIVQTCLEASLEKSLANRTNIAKLLSHLVSHGRVLPEQYVKGVVDNMELAIDLELDLPKVWSCLAELVAPIFYSSGGKVKLACLTDLADPLLEEGKSAIFVVEILKKLVEKMTVDTAVQYWKDSNMIIEYFFKSASRSDIIEFLQRHNLEEFYLANIQPHASETLSTAEVTFKSYVINITKQLKMNKSHDALFEWIEANVKKEERSQPIFIRALTTATCQDGIKQVQSGRGSHLQVDKDVIKRHSLLLKKYIDDDSKELQAVYALQKLFVDLEQPPNILKLLFDYLYDEDVICEQTFFKWEKDEDATECDGKGVALLSVNPFLTWLREAEVESDE